TSTSALRRGANYQSRWLARRLGQTHPDLTRYWIPSLIREVQPVQDFITLVALWRLFRKERPQVVHTHSSKAGILGRWAAWLAGVPNIFHTAHGFGFNDFQRPFVRNLYIWLEKITG